MRKWFACQASGGVKRFLLRWRVRVELLKNVETADTVWGGKAGLSQNKLENFFKRFMDHTAVFRL